MPARDRRSSPRHRPKHRAVVILGLCLGLAAAACGDEPLTQPRARDHAAEEVCNYAARCGQIGPAPAPHPTRDSCLTTWKANVEGLWPAADCTKIVQAEYDVCIASIKAGTCGNGLDVLTIFSKCGKATVCGTP